MVWLTLGLITLLGLLLVWAATRDNRSARMVGAAAVILHTLTLMVGLGSEPTSTWISIAGVIGVASQAVLLSVVTLWIATTRSRFGRVVGGLILAVLAVALTYGMISGPVWKINVLNVAAIALTWIAGRREKPVVSPA